LNMINTKTNDFNKLVTDESVDVAITQGL